MHASDANGPTRSRRRQPRAYRPLPLLSLAALALAVIVAAVTAPGVGAIALISVNDEVQLGREAQREVRAQVPVLSDGRVLEYVQAVGRRLAARAGGPKYPYTFSVANYRELNAFALPGGPVWIHRGILHAAGNESQVAGV